MSASLASAMMNAFEDGLALISASLASSDFILFADLASRFYLRQRFSQRPGGLLQCHLLFWPKFDFDMLFDPFSADHRRHAETDVSHVVSPLNQRRNW